MNEKRHWKMLEQIFWWRKLTHIQSENIKHESKTKDITKMDRIVASFSLLLLCPSFSTIVAFFVSNSYRTHRILFFFFFFYDAISQSWQSFASLPSHWYILTDQIHFVFMCNTMYTLCAEAFIFILHGYLFQISSVQHKHSNLLENGFIICMKILRTLYEWRYDWVCELELIEMEDPSPTCAMGINAFIIEIEWTSLDGSCAHQVYVHIHQFPNSHSKCQGKWNPFCAFRCANLYHVFLRTERNAIK